MEENVWWVSSCSPCIWCCILRIYTQWTDFLQLLFHYHFYITVIMVIILIIYMSPIRYTLNRHYTECSFENKHLISAGTNFDLILFVCNPKSWSIFKIFSNPVELRLTVWYVLATLKYYVYFMHYKIYLRFVCRL